MSKPNFRQIIENGIKYEKIGSEPQIFRSRRERIESKTVIGDLDMNRLLGEPQSLDEFEIMAPELPQVDSQESSDSGKLISSKTRHEINLVSRYKSERNARLRAETKLRKLQIEFSVLAKRTGQAEQDIYSTEHARLLILEAAERRAKASQIARDELARKLKEEHEAAELLKSQAEADRNAWQHRERANVLLRKAVQKAQERLANEAMASKAAEFKLQTERELAMLAEQRAYVELQSAREVELRLRAESKELASINEGLSNRDGSSRDIGQQFGSQASTNS